MWKTTLYAPSAANTLILHAHRQIMSNALREGKRKVSTKHWTNKQFYAANCFLSNRLHYDRVCDAHSACKIFSVNFSFFHARHGKTKRHYALHALRIIYASRSICNTERTALNFFFFFQVQSQIHWMLQIIREQHKKNRHMNICFEMQVFQKKKDTKKNVQNNNRTTSHSKS